MFVTVCVHTYVGCCVCVLCHVVEPDILYVCMYVCVAGAVALTLEQAEHEEREKDLKTDKRSLKTELREVELAHEAAIKKLKLVSIFVCTSYVCTQVELIMVHSVLCIYVCTCTYVP